MANPKSKKLVWYDQRRNWKELSHLIFEVESIIKKQQQAGKGKLGDTISKIKSAKPFCDWPVVFLPNKGEAIFIGDTHGDSISTLAIIKQENFVNKVKAGKDVYLIFLGDYADRGKRDVRNIEIILNLKKKYPDHVFLLRGNHEELSVGQYYGFLASCIKRFDYEKGQNVFQRFNDLFEHLPVMVVLANGVVAVHGGVPVSEINSLTDLTHDEDIAEIRWNDPTEEIDNFIFNYKRGCYYLFGKKVFNNFMKAIGGRVLVRSHEYFSAGYKFLFNHKILSIFSNGGTSPESGYRDIILKPKYVKVHLARPLNRWTAQQVFDIKY